jgi:hypothetical protein
VRTSGNAIIVMWYTKNIGEIGNGEINVININKGSEEEN